jgi:hypothetical protein
VGVSLLGINDGGNNNGDMMYNNGGYNSTFLSLNGNNKGADFNLDAEINADFNEYENKYGKATSSLYFDKTLPSPSTRSDDLNSRSSFQNGQQQVTSELDKSKVAGRRVWIRAAEILVKSGFYFYFIHICFKFS